MTWTRAAALAAGLCLAACDDGPVSSDAGEPDASAAHDATRPTAPDAGMDGGDEPTPKQDKDRPPKPAADAGRDTAVPAPGEDAGFEGDAEVPVKPQGPPAGLMGYFRLVTEEVGLRDYHADTGENGERHGPGGVFADLDNDGYPDMLLVTGDDEPAQLLSNREDSETGRRVYSSSMLEFSRHGSTGAVAADYDNDGDLDVFITNFGEDNQLLLNRAVEDGLLSFEDVTAQTDPTPGLDDAQHGLAFGHDNGIDLRLAMTAAWADVNRDGWPDLYVGNHNGWRGHEIYGDRPGERDILYINNGDGTFTDLTMQAGVPGYEDVDGQTSNDQQVFGSSNAVTFTDLNNDGWPDLVVTNKTWTDTDADMLYVNLGVDGEGQWLGFDAVNHDLGITNTLLSMGVAAADHDNDGDIDLYFTDTMKNPLWVNQLAETGSLGFVHSSRLDGPFSWGAQWQDFDNNGWLDLHLATTFSSQDVLIIDSGDNPTRSEKDFGINQRRDSRGTLSADYNRDGWPDLLVINLFGPSALFENEGHQSGEFANHHFLSIKLVGDPSGPGPLRSTRDALGARIVVTADTIPGGGLETLRRDVSSGEGNASGTGSLWVEVGLGEATTADLEVHWPSGGVTVMNDVTADQFVTIEE